MTHLHGLKLLLTISLKIIDAILFDTLGIIKIFFTEYIRELSAYVDNVLSRIYGFRNEYTLSFICSITLLIIP
nr:MAG TPA: hypothetical protein [Caudoviricetes sp.]